MRYFFDTEFIEDGKTVDLISIGIVAEDGRELYIESSEADLSRASDWVKKNVLPHLKGTGVSRAEMLRQIVTFIGGDTKPQFWAYYATYDWICLCQLWGLMIELPKHWPKFPRDLIFLAKLLNFDTRQVKHAEVEHDALADARWNKHLFDQMKASAAGVFLADHTPELFS